MASNEPSSNGAATSPASVGRDAVPAWGEFSARIAAMLLAGCSEYTLAEQVRIDGRLRIAAGVPVSLTEYCASLPGLVGCDMVLDAVIDVCLQAAPARNVDMAEATRMLVQERPDLEGAIRRSAQLSAALDEAIRSAEDASGQPSPAAPSELGPRLPNGSRRYRLLRRIGRGSFADVYLAEDMALSSPGSPAMVAAKVLRGHPRHRPAADLTAEAQKARRLNNPAVVRVHDLGESDDGHVFVIYEYLEGGSLEDFRAERGGRIRPREAVRLIADVCRGVAAVHSAGLVHCDLKPGNVLLARDGTPKVADFGVAIRFGGDGPIPRESAPPLGSLGFMAPEQLRNEAFSLTPAADVYALGGLLGWLITGLIPNGGTWPELVARLASDPSEQEPVSPMVESLRRIDRDLGAIVARAMHPDPSRRHPSASQLGEDLERWLRHEPIAWTGPSLWRRGRLLARRRPMAVALSLAFAAAAALVLATLATNARLRQSLAEQSRAIAAYQDHARGEMERFVALLSMMQTRPGAAEPLRAVDTLERLHQPWLSLEPAPPDVLSRERIRVTREVLDRLQRGGGSVGGGGGEEGARGEGGGLEARLWETALCFLLVQSGQWREPLERLGSLEGYFRGVLPDGDPWLDVLAAVRAAAECNRIAEAGRSAGVRRELRKLRKEAAELRRTIRALERRAEDPAYPDAVRALLQRSARGLSRAGRAELPPDPAPADPLSPDPVSPDSTPPGPGGVDSRPPL